MKIKTLTKYINSKILWVLITLSIVALGFGLFQAGSLAADYINYKSKFSWGAFDPRDEFVNDSKVKIQNKFWGWNGSDYSQLDDILNKSKYSTQTLLLTVEPWLKGNYSPADYYTELEKDTNKTIIKQTCVRLDKYIKDNNKSEVYLRWSHEMDLAGQSRYPWANGDKVGFIKAFRNIVTECRKINNKIKIVWSPSGNKESIKYYPGSAYLDVIAFSVFSNPEWELKNLGKLQNFRDIFNTRYEMYKNYSKPIWVAEGGVGNYSADSNYQAKWWQDAKKDILDPIRYVKLQTFVYYYDNEKFPWYNSNNLPDYRIPKDQLFDK